MEYSNSHLAEYTRLSLMHSGQRKYPISRITPHVYEGQMTVEQMGEYFADPDRQVSCNYCIGKDGRIGLIVEEQNRSWCSSNPENDGRGITIECASDKTPPYAVNLEVFDSLVNLCADICRRYGKTRLLWIPDKAKALAYIPAENEMLLTVHQWFANTSCPGEYMIARMGELAERVTAMFDSYNQETETNEPSEIVHSGLQASELVGLSNSEVIERVAPLFIADQKQSGILASVSLAQFLLETGYGQRSELFRNANNAFGMKCPLSGNTWSGSTWDGESMYSMDTPEQWKDGTWHTIHDVFRAYYNMEDSIADHSAYLLGAMNGDKLRYDGLKGCKDYRQAFQIIQNGEYATAHTYAEQLCEIMDMWNLTQYDVTEEKSKPIQDTVIINKEDFESLKVAYATIAEVLKKYE